MDRETDIELEWLGVSPTYQGLKIGRKVMEKTMDHVRSSGSKLIIKSAPAELVSAHL